MEKEEQELVDFIFENRELLKNMYTLYKHKSSFSKELILMDIKIIKQNEGNSNISIQSILDAQIDDTSSSIEEIGKLLEIKYPWTYYSDKKKYLNRALYFLENYKNEDRYLAKLLYSLGTFYEFIGRNYKTFLPLYKRALRIQRKVLDKNHTDRIDTLVRLGLYYSQYVGYEFRTPILLQYALKMKEKNLGINNDLISYMQESLNPNHLIGKKDKYFFTNSCNSNLSLKIDRVEIQNFKQFTSFEIDFSNHINIIIGQNATGKTSLLQAITLALLKEDSPDELNSYRHYINKNRGVNSANIKIYFDGYQKNIKLLKEKREIDNNYFIPFVLAYGSNFFTEYFRDSKRKVKEILEKEIYDSLASSIFEDFVDDFANPLGILESLEFSRRKNAKEVQSIFLETINSFLEEYQITSNIEGDFFFIKGDGEIPLYLEDLSEGYRSNVLLISDMLIKILGVGWTPKTIEGIVLIDEFDKHLHPRWQSKLVNQLTKTFPKIQFIMTTHNPMSILDRDANQIAILKEVNGKIISEKKQGTKNIDVAGILLEYFGVDTVIGETLQSDLEKFTKLNIKDNLIQEESQELEELREKLSKTIAVNFINDYRYFEYLKKKEINTPKIENIYSAIDDLGDIL